MVMNKFQLSDEDSESNSSSCSLELVVEKGNDDSKIAELMRDNIYNFDPETMKDKPWLKPGADITDYFNYGFTEKSWMKYCELQRENRDFSNKFNRLDRGYSARTNRGDEKDSQGYTLSERHDTREIVDGHTYEDSFNNKQFTHRDTYRERNNYPQDAKYEKPREYAYKNDDNRYDESYRRRDHRYDREPSDSDERRGGWHKKERASGWYRNRDEDSYGRRRNGFQ